MHQKNYSNQNLILKKRIMRKIYLLWFLKKINSPVSIKTGIFLISATLAGYYISFISIFKNALKSSHSPIDLTSFFVRSFSYADLPSKLIVLMLLASIYLLLEEVFKKRDFYTLKAQ